MTSRIAAGQGATGAPSIVDEDSSRWLWRALAAIALVLLARLGLLALDIAPLHFDEAQYWTYGEALDWGYYSKPPMIAWIIRLGSEIFGATPFGVRVFSPVIHSVVACLVFLIARRLFDARTGFWSAIAYLAVPGVTVGAALMTTDTPMMAAWALGLYALVRIAEPGPATDGKLGWYALFGVALGFGLLSKYTIVALPAGALGYALFSREGGAGLRASGPGRVFAGRALAGAAVALAAALIVWSPNLWWNAENGFASILHVADNAKLGDGPAYDPEKALEFVVAQIGVFGPVLFVALAWMATQDGWRREWPYRLLIWISAPLLLAMIVQAFLSRAHPNWAAPAYIGFTIAVSAWLLDRRRARWLQAAAVVGVLVFAGFLGYGLYLKEHRLELPRIADIFKKMRPGPAVCERALPLRDGRPLFSADRRLLADCMFMAKLGVDDIRIFTGGAPGNHYQLVAPLEAGDGEPLLLVHAGPRSYIDGVLRLFDKVEILDEGAIPLHADRSTDYVIAAVQGYLSPPGDEDAGQAREQGLDRDQDQDQNRDVGAEAASERENDVAQ